MTALIVTIHVIVCLVLILVILLQAGRGSGLSWGSFGGTPQSFLGTKSATFLAKATSVSAIVFLITCISLNVIDTKKSKSLFETQKPNKIDVDKIKKVLEKVKAEEAKTPAAEKSTAPAPTPTSTVDQKSLPAAQPQPPTPAPNVSADVKKEIPPTK